MTTLIALLRRAEAALEPFKHWYEVRDNDDDSHVELAWTFGDRGHFDVFQQDFRIAAAVLADIRAVIGDAPKETPAGAPPAS